MPRRLLAALCAAAGLVITACTAQLVLHGYPFSHDEYTYLYQAMIFARGQLSFPAEAWMAPLVEPCMLLAHGVFSRYPPGFSLLLVPGVWLGMPWLVNPLLSAATIWVLCASLIRLCGKQAALLAVLLLLTSALFAGYGGSYFAQPLSLLCAAVAFAAFMQEDGLPIMGIACAALVLVRPLDAFCLALAMSAGGAAMQKKNYVLMPFFSLLTGAALLLLYNYHLSGIWSLSLTSTVWVSEFRIHDPDARGWWAGLASIAHYYAINWQRYVWPCFWGDFAPWLPGLLVCAVAGALLAPRPLVIASVTFCATLVGLYAFHPNLGNPLYGARYWYPSLAPLVLLSGYAVQYLLQRRGLFFITLIYGLVALAQFAGCLQRWDEYRPRMEAMDMLRHGIEMQCPVHSVVVLHPLHRARPGGWPPFVDELLMKRNAFMQGDRLYVHSEDAAREVAAHTGYTPCDGTYPR